MPYSVIDHGASEGVVANDVPRQPRAYIILLPDKRKEKSDVDIIFGNDYNTGTLVSFQVSVRATQ